MTKVRCAIYTRKSSEEGLEQDFNSLDAQREACAAYIRSQRSEGWSLTGGSYDDGGLSGGTMKRPALQQLLADIRAGRIDIVVVYKVDRLTRSLLDFARLVETFDKAGVSFVSVTQSFNTTTSMGRLTLNMLLSFAQFEREVTAERIRDKIAASKARGMWMGGIPPLGYEPDGRSLRIVEEHAELIRMLFRRYLELGNVRLLVEQLAAEGVGVPRRTLSTGRPIGGVPFTRGQVYKILSNPVYAGKIQHREVTCEGLHEAIVDRGLWDAVQARLGENRQGEQRAATIRSPSLLAGKVFDEKGEPLVTCHACKGKVRYRYYVSRSLQHDPGSQHEGWRIPARELEGAVIARLAELLDDPLALLAQLGNALEPAKLASLAASGAELAGKVRQKRAATIRSLVRRVRVQPDQLTITLDAPAIAAALGHVASPEHQCIKTTVAVRLTRTGRAVRLVSSGGRAPAAQVDDQLAALLTRSREWWTRLQEQGITVTELALSENLTHAYVTRVLKLSFLAPDIVEAILAGSQPAMLSSQRLKATDFPISWKEQREAFGFAAV